jgi:hypothetical protein
MKAIRRTILLLLCATVVVVFLVVRFRLLDEAEQMAFPIIFTSLLSIQVWCVVFLKAEPDVARVAIIFSIISLLASAYISIIN